MLSSILNSLSTHVKSSIFSDCGSPPSPGNGNVSLDFGVTTFGSSATRKCDPGYVIDGNPTMYCEEDGVWSDLPLTCSLEGMN